MTKIIKFTTFKLKSAVRNSTEVTLNLSSILMGNLNDETSFPHKLFVRHHCPMSVSPSAHMSIQVSLNFLIIGSLVFFSNCT